MSNKCNSRGQGNLNFGDEFQAVLAERIKTDHVRRLIYELTGRMLSARQVVRRARSQRPESCKSGKLLVQASSPNREGRYLVWDVVWIPASYSAA